MCICPKIVKDVKNVEKSRFWSRSRDFCQIFYDLGFGFKKISIRKKVSVSVSKLLPIFWGYRFRFQKIWYRKKSLGIGFEKFGIGKKVSVSVSVKFLVSSFSWPRGAPKILKKGAQQNHVFVGGFKYHLRPCNVLYN